MWEERVRSEKIDRNERISDSPGVSWHAEFDTENFSRVNRKMAVGAQSQEGSLAGFLCNHGE